MRRNDNLTTTMYHVKRLAAGFAFILALPIAIPGAANQVLSWNNLGMHCMDSDYSVFSILPPYNTIEAQLIVNGRLVTASNGFRVTYQALSDPSGSINSTAMGKGNFYSFSSVLFGATPAPEMGLAGWGMPGTNNIPQRMLFESTNVPAAGVAAPVNWFRAEGIPISPYDDAHRKNTYPLMRVIAWNSANQPIATNDIVLPVSDEMDCRGCHASGSVEAARPDAGWCWDGIPERDYRLNILRLHDDRQFSQSGQYYGEALAAKGFNSAGLYRNVTADGKPVLCATCHASEALGTSGYGFIPPLTTSMHTLHASVLDPVQNTPLDSVANRSACYQCHPGSTTRCLRGAMGGAVAADGSMDMECQSCHGTMSQVGDGLRVGWFMEPDCQSCHTGTAIKNSGQIRYTSVFTDTNGTVRIPADPTFATQTNTPATGLSLFRFSAGHGGLQCEACHGSTHAEFPSTHPNDNLRNIGLQGHVGITIECNSCHTSTPDTDLGGPHGIHPVGQSWVSRHPDIAENNPTRCQPCHGMDYRGTVLSRAQANRTLNIFATNITIFRGATIGCYTCHRGPSGGGLNPSVAPAVLNVSTNTTNDKAVVMKLPMTGAGAWLRIISQPESGSVGIDTNAQVATYYPAAGFVGAETFTYAAYNGSKNSNLGTGTVSVVQGPFSLGVTARVPPTHPAGWPVAFSSTAAITNNASSPLFDWDFGDGTAHGTNQNSTHTYSLPGTYRWKVVANLAGQTAESAGTITIDGPIVLGLARGSNTVTLNWSDSIVDTLVEHTTNPAQPDSWVWANGQVAVSSNTLSLTLPASGTAFYRVKRPW